MVFISFSGPGEAEGVPGPGSCQARHWASWISSCLWHLPEPQPSPRWRWGAWDEPLLPGVTGTAWKALALFNHIWELWMFLGENPTPDTLNGRRADLPCVPAPLPAPEGGHGLKDHGPSLSRPPP